MILGKSRRRAILVATAVSSALVLPALHGCDAILGLPASVTITDGAPPPRCDPSKPYRTIEVATDLAGAVDAAGPGFFRPRLVPDEQTIYFSRRYVDDASDFWLYRGTRDGEGGPFEVTRLQELQMSGQSSYSPSPTSNNKTLYFTQSASDAGIASIIDLKTTTRADLNSPFGTPTSVHLKGMGDLFEQPYILPDATALYAVRNVPGTSATRIVRVPISQGEVDPDQATTLDELPPNAQAPTPLSNELTLYFSTPYVGGANGQQVWVARRASKNDKFVPEPIPELKLEGVSFFPSWVSDDTCVMYLDVSLVGGRVVVAPYRAMKAPVGAD